MTRASDRNRQLSSKVQSPGFYVCEGEAHVGPFATLLDAQHFIDLIRIFGENVAGIEVVEVREGEQDIDKD